MKYRGIILVMGLVIAVGQIIYWTSVFAGASPVVELVPGYTAWYWSFPVPDAWLCVTSVLLAIAIVKKRDSMAAVCGLLVASAGIFMALNELSFIFMNGMIYLPFSDIVVDLGINIFYLAVGVFLIKQCTDYIRKLALSNT